MTRKRILLIYFGFLLALLATTALILQESGMSHAFVESLLSRFLNPDRFSLGTARIDLGNGSVTLENLHLSTGNDGKNLASVDVETVTVVVDTNPLGQVGSVQEIELTGVEVDLDLSGGRLPDFSALLLTDENELLTGEGRTPAIVLRDSRITLRISPDSEPIQFTEVNLKFLPGAEDHQNMILTGSMLAPGGYEVKVSGSGNVADLEFRALLEMGNIPLGANIARPYSADAVNYLERSGIQGVIKKLSAWFEYAGDQQEGDREELVIGANLEITDLSCTLPDLPYPLVGARARIAVNSRDQGTARFLIENQSIHGDLTAEGSITNGLSTDRQFEVRVHASDLLISPTLVAALRQIDVVKRILNATQPTAGRADADLRLWTRRPGGPLETSLDLELKGVSATYHGFPSQDGRRIGFPSPVSQIQGRVHVRPGLITLDSIQGILANATIQVDGSIRVPGEGVPAASAQGIDLDIRAQNLVFSAAMRDNLSKAYPPAAEIYDQYSPSGQSDVRVTIKSDADPATAPKIRVVLRLQGVRASYQAFPLAIEQLRGKVDISNQGVAFDVQGNRGTAELSVHGQFLLQEGDQIPSGSLQSELWLTCTDLEFDAELEAAIAKLSDAGRDIWQEIDPRGHFDCELSLWRRAGDPDLSYDIRVDLDQVVAQPELAHQPITNLAGPIFVHGSAGKQRVDLSAIQGLIYNGPNSEPARLVLQGAIEGNGNDQRFTLNAVVRDLQLTDQFAEFLDRSDALNLETWKLLQPSGYIDIISELEWTMATNELDTKFRIQLKNVAADAEFLPDRASRLNGEVLIDDGRVSFQDIRGLIGDSPVQCTKGSIRRENDASIVDVLVAAESFPIDARLANLMSGPLRETYLQRNMVGSAKVRRLQLTLTIPDEGSMLTELNGNILLRRLDMDLGTRLHDLSGSWTIESALIGEQAGSVTGTLENSTVTVLGHSLRGLSGRFTADSNRVVIRELQGRIHNGRLIGNAIDGDDLVYDLTGPGNLSLNLSWEQVSLLSLLRTLGFGEDGYRGNLSGEIALREMPGNRILNAKASGRVQISEGQLGVVPLFSAIYSYLSPRRRPRFDAASLTFDMDTEKISIADMEILSPVLTVTGEGYVRLDGYLNLSLDFPDFFGKAADWLVVPRLIKFFGNRLVQFQVFGYLRNPRAQPRWLWQRQAAEVPIAPIPAYRPKHL